MFNRTVKSISLVLILGFTGFELNQAQTPSFLDDSVTYLWPTDATRQLSSTFAETRSAHLHAGLDIRTWGREGYRVFATRDAVVHRVAMGPTGYGNVVYLKHNDGSYSVYAHLNRFEPELQAYIDSLRLIDYTFEIDVILEDKNFRYNKGDVIAFTGSTGIGPPHLHFELRTPEFKPFNPLLTNLGVRDNIPPVFRQLGIEHLDSKTLHLQNFDIKSAQKTTAGYNFGKITVDGPIGLSVNVHDRANDTPNVYAVYTLTMVHKSDTLFHSRADYFSYREAGHMFLDRSYPILAQTRRAFQRLYVVEGNRLPFYSNLKNRGVLYLEDGTYPIHIIATDIYGNKTTATVEVQFENSSPPAEITYVPVYPVLEKQTAYPKHHINRIKLSENPPLLASIHNEWLTYPREIKPISFSTVNSTEKRLIPGKLSILRTPDHKLWIEIPMQALYDSLDIRMEISEQENEIHFSFEPNRLPIDGSIYFNYILPVSFRNNDRLALFSVDQYRNREFRLRSTNSNGILRASLREISNLVIREDRMAPWVGNPRLQRNLAGNHIVIVPTRDNLTGIDFRKSSITVNNEKGIVEYDPEKNFLIFYRPDFQPQRNNRVEVRVFDGVGNSTVRSYNLSYTP